MVALQLIDHFEAKLEGGLNVLNAMLKAQNTKFNLLLSLIGVGRVALIAMGFT